MNAQLVFRVAYAHRPRHENPFVRKPHALHRLARLRLRDRHRIHAHARPDLPDGLPGIRERHLPQRAASQVLARRTHGRIVYQQQAVRTWPLERKDILGFEPHIKRIRTELVRTILQTVVIVQTNFNVLALRI